jgi:Ca2+ transporting ATPase
MEGADFIKLIGGVVCKNCNTPKCDCARDTKEQEKTGK